MTAPPLARGAPEPWATDWGRDRHGYFMGFRVKGVLYRFRWIPPGRFMMGSPETEVGRSGDEGPLHEVVLSTGFWLGETPVTQGLWDAVMGSNPSRFPGGDHPVEHLSWPECEGFIVHVNTTVTGLAARFPTEAEWEYGCRAGTKTATWAGDLKDGEEIRSPRVDRIAWYSGNSDRATHAVGGKSPNPWGLHDMLGNVYEWCGDWYSWYESGLVVDPRGSTTGTLRVFRGGSWGSDAQYVRAASRFGSHPEDRVYGLGFRLARGQSPRSGGGAEVPRSGDLRRSAEAPRSPAPVRDASAPTVREHESRSNARPSWARSDEHDDVGRVATLVVDGVRVRFRWIPAGSFVMGSPADEVGANWDESPQYEVTLTRGFWLMETPVTQALWQAVMGRTPSRFAGPERPVERVSWSDVGAFVEQLNRRVPKLAARLPIEVEWEYACRGGTKTATWNGDLARGDDWRSDRLDGIAWYRDNASGSTQPVGQARANPFGLYDMLGNVWEWCEDWYRDYPHVLTLSERVPRSGQVRVRRGGSWLTAASSLRAAERDGVREDSRFDDLGFRLAVDDQDARTPSAVARRAFGSPLRSSDIERRASPQPPPDVTRARTMAQRPRWTIKIGKSGAGPFQMLRVGDAFLRFRQIHSGRFQMGSSGEEYGRTVIEGPRHEVELTQEFWLADAPVTQDIWEAVMGSNPSRFVDPGRPVENVSWDDCVAFLARCKEQWQDGRLRLPTEAEWEYACRAGTETSTWEGDVGGDSLVFGIPMLDSIAWTMSNSGGTSHPVRALEANPLGLYDMLGNVFEWCQDVLSPYLDGRVVDPVALTQGPQHTLRGGAWVAQRSSTTAARETKRIIRGGSWASRAGTVRAAYREALAPNTVGDRLGFRVVLEAD